MNYRPRLHIMGIGLVVLAAATAIAGETFAEEENRDRGTIDVGDLGRREILAGAAQRIAALRRGSVALTLKGPDGKVLPAGTAVTLTMTRHAFAFGGPPAPWFMDESHAHYAELDRRWREIHTYAVAPFYWYGKHVRLEDGKVSDEVFQRAERVVAWAEKHGFEVKGHPLCWSYKDPAWMPDDPGRCRELMRGYVRQAMTRFQGRIRLWDVVNEAAEFEEGSRPKLAPVTTEMIARLTPAGYVREMCLLAREVDPEATLVVNEATHALRRLPKMEKMFTAIQKDEDLFDAIGMQFHQGTNPIPIEQVWAAVNRLGRFSSRIQITEVTFATRSRKDEKKQADAVETFYRAMFSHPRVESIAWWSIWDAHSFQEGGGLLREDLSPKPAFERLRQLIREEWWTPPVAATADAAGAVALDGFFGDYAVSATLPDGTKLAGTLRHRRGVATATVTLAAVP